MNKKEINEKDINDLSFEDALEDKEVELELHKLVDSREPIWWRVEDDE